MKTNMIYESFLIFTIITFILEFINASHYSQYAGSGTCVGSCGGKSTNCYCDSACFRYKDCCTDMRPTCRVPEIVGVSPTEGTTSGNTLITVTGKNFENEDCGVGYVGTGCAKGARGRVRLGGASGPLCTINTWTDVKVTCYTQQGIGANKYIYVQNNFEGVYDQQFTSGTIKFSYSKPYINSISPGNGPTNGGTALYISGSNFGSNSLGVPSIKIAGKTCTSPSATSHTSITCNSPFGQGLVQSVIVTVGSQTSNTGSFSYDGPTISGLSVPAGTTTLGNVLLTITGTSMGKTGATIEVGGKNCPRQSQLDNQITCTLPAGQGTNLIVKIKVESLESNSLQFSYPAPVITGLRPSGTWNTAGGEILTIDGKNFGTSATVSVGSGDIVTPSSTSGTSHSHTIVKVRMPAGQGLNVEVTITVSGQKSAAVTLNYGAPVISSIQQSSNNFPTAGNVIITINGYNFGQSPSITVAGRSCPRTGLGNTFIYCQLPIGQGADQPVVVTAGSQKNTPNLAATIDYNLPNAQTVTENHGPTKGGTTLVIGGTDFGASTGSVNIIGNIGGSSVSYTCYPDNWSQTSISCTLPPGEGTSLSVQVIVSGVAQTNNLPSFNYDEPTVGVITPSQDTTAGGNSLTIAGTNFGRTPTVTIGGQNCINPTVSNLDQRIVCIIPASVNQLNPLDIIISIKGYASITKSNIFSYLPFPTITTIAPKFGSSSGNTLITVTGASFGQPKGTLKIGGTNGLLCNIQSWTHTQITCYTPKSEGSGQQILITATNTNYQNTLSADFAFDYLPPYISYISPLSAVTGGNALPTVLTIVGTSFGISSPTITVGNKPCNNIHDHTHTSVMCNLPEGSGTGEQVILTVGGQSSNTETFDYLPPTINSISPTTYSTNGMTTLTLYGSSFGTSLSPFSERSIKVGDENCQIVANNHKVTTCTLPPGTGASNRVRITVSGQTSISSVYFAYLPPQITGLSGSQFPTVGGSNIVLTGFNFGNNKLDASVQVNGVPGTVNVNPSHTSLTFVLPAGEGKNRDVIVTINGQNSNSVSLSYDAPIIDIPNGIEPISASTAGKIPITIRGQNFGTTATVTIGGIECGIITRVPHIKIICELPEGQGKNLLVQVFCQTQKSTENIWFSYDIPAITPPLNPANSPTSGNMIMTINGNNFGKSGTVTIGTQVCYPVSGGWSHTVVKCTIPPGEGTNLNVQIIVATQQSLTQTFNYDPPTISSVNPLSGSTIGGYPVTIIGTNFGVAATRVYIGEQVCSVTFLSHVKVVCSKTSGYGSNLPVKIQVLGQNNITAAGGGFTFSNPSIVTVAPVSGATNGQYYLTITGDSFGSQWGEVLIGTNECIENSPNTLWSHKQIICKVPSGTGVDNDLKVTTSDNKFVVSSNRFDYDAPYIVSINPPNAYTGDGPRDLTILGTSFGTGTQASIKVGNLACNPTLNQQSKIICTIPENQGEEILVVVTVDNQESNSIPFSYAAPTITNINPPTGSTAGGSKITLTGTSFGTSGSLTIGQRQCDVYSHQHSKIVAYVPNGEGFGLDIQLIVANQLSTSLVTFSYDKPNITKVVPSNGPTVGMTQIQIQGYNFGLGTAIVQIGGKSCQTNPSTLIDTLIGSKINCTLPPGEDTNKEVQIIVGSQVSDAVNFNYDPPFIANINPSKGLTEGNELLTIFGTNFGSSAYATIGGVRCGFSSIPIQDSATNGNFKCYAPEGKGTQLPIKVFVGSQSYQPNIATLSYDYKDPTITNVQPLNGPTLGGTIITLTGTSFSTTPQVTVGNLPCTLALNGNTHRIVRCTVAEGQGRDQEVKLLVGSQNGVYVNKFHYNAPNIENIQPTLGPTNGGIMLTVTGSNFGISGTLRIDNNICDHNVIGGLYEQSTIECQLPAGRGSSLNVQVDVSSQFNPFYPYTYASPTISKIYPLDGSTDGQFNVSITGSNFGCDEPPNVPSDVFVIFRNILYSPLWCNHTLIIFSPPAGIGGPYTTSVSIANQQSLSYNGFKYNAPIISSVTGCTPFGTKTVECPVNGGVTIYVNGENFGENSNSPELKIDGKVCAGSTVTIPHKQISCNLPKGVGFDLTVRVTAGIQYDEKSWLSYVHPTIVANTLQFVPTNGQVSHINVTSVDGLETVSFKAKDVSTDITKVWVSYGLSTLSNRFNCTLVSIGNKDVNNEQLITCNISPGVGSDHQFRIIVYLTGFNPQITADGDDTLSYPRPVIIDNTIRSEFGVEGNNLQGTSSQGQLVLFKCLNLGSDPTLIKVRYGSKGNMSTSLTNSDSMFDCLQVQFTNVPNQIQCTTSAGAGNNLVFQVIALNSISEPGNDTYNYPQPPEVISISGCTDTYPKTTNCPTKGGNTLIISGNNFADNSASVIIKVGSQTCGTYVYYDSNTISCKLPEGTGSDLTVTVINNGLFSIPKELLSYSSPVISHILPVSGTYECQVNINDNTIVEACPRDKNPRIELVGENFGPTDSIIFVGGSACTNVIHSSSTPHESLTCSVPDGRGINSIFMVQDQGEASQVTNNVRVAYELCPIGTRNDFDPSITTCQSCMPGYFAGKLDSLICDSCEAGFYSNSSLSSSCSSCEPGYFSMDGASNCTKCDTGEFSEFPGAASCKSCPAGRSASNTGSSLCDRCTAGRFASSAGLDTCKLCASGSYSSDEALTCSLCPAGKYSDGTFVCEDCVKGKYQPSSGQSNCLSAPKGTFVNSDGQYAYVSCDSGFYSNDTELTTCLKCEAGYSSKKIIGSSTGPQNCDPCNPGSYIDVGGQGNCLSCILGEWNNQSASTNCLQCKAGKITSNLGSTICELCNPGYFAYSSGLGRCEACEYGRYAEKQGSSICNSCNDGWSQPSPGSSSCIQCKVDQFSAAQAQQACTLCPLGKYSNVNGSTACLKCSSGYFKDSGSIAAKCEECQPGYFTSGEGQGGCASCALGTYSLINASSCIVCSPGYFAGTSASIECKKCIPGRISPSQQADSCALCSPGFYQFESGKTKCDACQAGKAQGSVGASKCEDCQAGYYSSISKQGACLICPPGKYSNATLATKCNDCKIGEYQNIAGSSYCKICSPGEYGANIGQEQCEECQPGKYQSISGSSHCLLCEQGLFSSTKRQSVCSNCTAGTYAATKNSFQCLLCQKGEYNSKPGMINCDKCTTGLYQGSEGQSDCSFCAAGRYTPGPGEARCKPCPVGRFSDKNDTKVSECTLCEPGKYQDMSETTSCKLCPAGKYSIYNGSLGCDLCAPGFINTEDGTTTCSFCPRGYFQVSYGKTECTPCKQGRYQSSQGQAFCQACPIGTYSNVTNTTACIPCQKGYVAPFTESLECNSCTPGRYMTADGQAQCLDCRFGSYSNISAATICTLCEVGRKLQQLAQTKCEKCIAGKFADRKGESVCRNCNPGTYASSEESSKCTSCGIGRVQNVPASTSCTSCSTGFYSPTIGQIACVACESGYYSNGTNIETCTPCNPGEYSDKSSSSSCQKCGSGKYTEDYSQRDCSLCPVGRYQPSTGQLNCLECSPGYYADSDGLSKCKPCNEGEFSPSNQTFACTRCPLGFFGNTTGLTDCLSCEPGLYQPSAGKQGCLYCDPGYYAPDYREHKCLACSPGTYNIGGKNGTSQCIPCTPGYAQSLQGQGQCEPCTQGTHTLYNGSTICQNCDIGTYANLTGQSKCDFCEPGSFSDSTNTFLCELCNPGSSQQYRGQTECLACKSGFFGSEYGLKNCSRCKAGSVSVKAATGSIGPTICDPCKEGTFVALPGQMECNLCPLGYYTNKEGQTSCEPCGTGTFADKEGATECKPCLQGRYTDGNGTIQCKSCEPGKSSDTLYSTSCKLCDKGKSQSGSQQQECVLCDFGWYGGVTGLPECLQCPNGRYSNQEGSWNCTLCSPGTFANDTALRECYNCSAGKYQSNYGQNDCKLCPLRTHSSKVGAKSCKLCEPGRYGFFEGLLECFNCDVGYAQDKDGQIQCKACTRGRYQNETGKVECKKCEPGFYENRANSTKCLPCAKGYYSLIPGADECLPCPSGTKASNIGTSRCSDCTQGYFQNLTAQTLCRKCVRGKFAGTDGSDVCLNCDSGTYSGVDGTVKCELCEPGRYMVESGATKCLDCDIKYYQPLSGQLACTPCPSGTYSNDTGLGECLRCETGKSSKLTGVSSCNNCSLGYHASTTGQTSCNPCQQGRFTNSNATSDCTTCYFGKYQNFIAQTTCKLCTIGLFSSLRGQKSCTLCPAGRKGNTTGLSNCIACPFGRYQPSQNKTVCELCPEGRFSPTTGASTCVLCQKGRAINTKGKSICDPCKPGTFANSTGFLECLKCYPGRFTNSSESSICELCPPGRALNESGQVSCLSCHYGQYQPLSGKTVCKKCVVGRFASFFEQTECLPCDITTFANVTGSKLCQQCAKGQFQNLTAQSKCYECQPGLYGSSPGLSKCSPCEEGTANLLTGQKQCKACDKGYYSSVTGAFTCIPCLIGSYAPQTRMSVCRLCESGYYSIKNGTENCLSCQEGRYQNAEGKTECTNCTIGKHAFGLASSKCNNCPLGRATNFTGQKECQKCEPGFFSNETRLVECYACSPGKQADTEELTECSLCGVGRYAKDYKLAECKSCGGGYAQKQTGQTICDACSPGYYSKVNQSNEKCIRCSLGSVTSQFGSPECTTCSTTSTSDANRTRCICDSDYYAPSTSSDETECLSCADGMNCDEPGTTESSLTTEVGWWRSSTTSLTFYRCLRRQHCLGGRLSTCDAHRIHVLCSVCQKGYHSIFGGECEKCPQSGASWVFIVFVLLCVALVYWASMYVVIRGGRALLEKESEQARKELFYGDVTSEAALGKTGVEKETMQQETIKLKKDFLIQRPAEFMFKLKILVTFLQIVTNIGVALEVPWPPEFKSFISFFSLTNLDVIQASSAECEMEAGFYRKFIIMSFAPLICVFVLVILYVLPQFKKVETNLKTNFASSPVEDVVHERLVQRKTIRRNFWKMVIFTFFLLYPVVSSTIFRIYVCKEVEGVKYLLADMRRTCDTDTWKAYASAAAFLVVLYPIGIPLMFLHFLWKYRKNGRLQEPGVKAQLGVLYDAFDSSLWWFEMADMLHKLILTSLLAFFPANLQLPFGLFVVITYTVVLLIAKPYKRKGDDRLHLLCQVEIFLYIYAGHLFFLQVDTDKNYDVVMAVVMIGMCLGIFLYFFSQFANVIMKKWKDFQLQRIMADPRKRRLHKQILRDRGLSDDEGLELARTAGRADLKFKKDQLSLEDQNVQLMRNPLAAMSSEHQMHMTDITGEDGLEENDTDNMAFNPLFSLQVPQNTSDDVQKGHRGSFLAQPNLD